ncbi:MAG: 4a-hydroxytetrahydrobiopterin dehydratase [Xanthomonadales bacterium]|nr:4a-hydroxytetrahydrobiopterin dehydratase [Xanthomonadales bacterium]
MGQLSDKHCKPCEGGAEPIAADRAGILLQQVPGWAVCDQGTGISKRFSFKQFNRTMAFVNGLAWVAIRQGHHPDIRAGYDYCTVKFTTHAIGGLSENDFICASRVNALLEK